MSIPADHILVVHGKLSVNVPRKLFKGDDAMPDEQKVAEFRKMLSERYPWLSENALDIFMKNAREKMLNIMDEETCGRNTARKLIAKDDMEGAVKHLRRWLNDHPENGDSWYLLGEVLCKIGRTEEGYAAIARGRSLK